MFATTRHTLWFALFALLVAGCDVIRPRVEVDRNQRVVEAAVFEGGYGIHWHQKIAERYSAMRAEEGVAVNLWGEPRMREKVKPRLLRGDPPDFILDHRMPIWLLIGRGKLHPLDDALDRPAYGSDRTWRDLFIPGTLDGHVSEGKTYAIPSAFGAWACWYDARQFREHGWTVPEDWDAFLALCEQIQADGVAPLAYQGKYPSYAWFTYVTLVQRCGGLAAVNRINALEPDPFSHPDAIEAARLFQDLALRFFQPGALAMTHIESQLQFVNGSAAMILCGLWLENEMRESTPSGFEMRCFNVPAVPGGKGNPTLFNGQGGEFLFVPADGSHPDLAADFARYLVSPLNGPDMGETIGVISPLRGATPREAVTPALQSALDMIEGAPGIFDIRLDQLLLEWSHQVKRPELDRLLRGDSTPEEFCAALDAGLRVALANPDLVIPAAIPYDEEAFGEPWQE